MKALPGLTTIGFDADDTLWHNERWFQLTGQRFAELLAGHGESAHISGRLLEAERRNLEFYGYGVKGFTLSMIETAVATSYRLILRLPHLGELGGLVRQIA